VPAVLINLFDDDKKERLEQEIAELKKKIDTYPMPNPPPVLQQALKAKEAELKGMFQ